MGSARGKNLGKRSEEIKQAQATLCGPGIFFELVVHVKSRDLKGVTAYRTGGFCCIRQLHADENGLDSVTPEQLAGSDHDWHS